MLLNASSLSAPPPAQLQTRCAQDVFGTGCAFFKQVFRGVGGGAWHLPGLQVSVEFVNWMLVMWTFLVRHLLFPVERLRKLWYFNEQCVLGGGRGGLPPPTHHAKGFRILSEPVLREFLQLGGGGGGLPHSPQPPEEVQTTFAQLTPWRGQTSPSPRNKSKRHLPHASAGRHRRGVCRFLTCHYALLPISAEQQPYKATNGAGFILVAQVSRMGECDPQGLSNLCWAYGPVLRRRSGVCKLCLTVWPSHFH